jgi:hypothetical protein
MGPPPEPAWWLAGASCLKIPPWAEARPQARFTLGQAPAHPTGGREEYRVDEVDRAGTTAFETWCRSNFRDDNALDWINRETAMLRFTAILFLAWMCNGCAAATTTSDEKPTGEVEFRRAEDKPAEGLKEAIIEGTEKKVYLHKKAELTKEDIAEALGNILKDKTLAIDILFTAEGKKKIEKLSKEHLNKPIAIIIDGKVVSAPVLDEVISERALISGFSTLEEVERIVSALERK